MANGKMQLAHTWTSTTRRETAGDRREAAESREDQLARRRTLLTRAVQDEVIPRLVGTTARMVARPARPVPPVGDAAELARLAMAPDAASAQAYFDEIHAAGAGLDRLYLELLTPAALRMGELWDDDSVDFVQVTIGLDRLDRIVRTSGSGPVAANRGEERSVLLTPAAGEQHTLGIHIVSEFFRRAGWQVASRLPSPVADLVAAVRAESFAVVGFSVGSTLRLDGLTADIRAVRRASRNPALRIMVGGPVFTMEPALAARIGADATATDGRDAVVQAERLLGAVLFA